MKKQRVLRWLLRRMRRRIPGLIIMTVSSVIGSLLGVAFALGTKNVINSATGGGQQTLTQAILVQAALIVGILVNLTLHRYLHSRLGAELDRDWKRSLTHRILRSDYVKISQFHSGELINRLNNDVRAVDDGVISLLPSLAAMVTKLVSVIAVLATMTPIFTAALLIAGVAVAVFTALARRYLRDLHKAVSASQGKLSGFLQEIFEKVLLVQAMNVEKETERRGDGLMEHRFALQKKQRLVSLTANTCVSILGYASGFAALAWCAGGIYRGTMNYGELVAITQLVAQLQSPFVQLSGVFPQYFALLAAAERIMELEEACRNEEKVQDGPPAMHYSALTAIGAEHLSFSYDRDEIFNDCSFSLPKGAFAVITGPSGIGKSTLLKLLLGIFKPNAGRLYLAGEEETVTANSSTRGLFAYVPQGNLLFSGTLRENLLLTCPNATQEQIDQAVYVSHMDGFLSQLPNGLDTMLGENAHGLSEGQAQRLSIARAVLGGAPVLLLDEATSALDAESEETVLRRIRQLPGKTCIVVTHRPCAKGLADWQLKVDGQKIICQKLQ